MPTFSGRTEVWRTTGVTGPDKLDARRSYLKAAMERVNRPEGLLDLVQVQRDFAR